MDYKFISYIIMLTVFFSYVIFIWLKYGVQQSISKSYYVLPQKINILFTIFCWGFSIPTIIIGVEQSILMFFAGASIAFVGAAAAFEEKLTYEVHMICAVLGVVLSQVAICISFHEYYVSAIFVILSIMLAFIKIKNLNIRKLFWFIKFDNNGNAVNHLWIIEILALISIALVYYLKIISNR